MVSFKIQTISILLNACVALGASIHPNGQADVMPPSTPNAPLTWTSRIGGPHGSQSWSDQDTNGNPVKRLQEIKMWCGDRLDGISFLYQEKSSGSATSSNAKWSGPHGSARGDPTVHIVLRSDAYVTEFITKVEGVNVDVGRGAASDRTRIGGLIFTTSDLRVLGCGKARHDPNKITWQYPGKALAFVNGNFGNEIDQITGAWVDFSKY